MSATTARIAYTCIMAMRRVYIDARCCTITGRRTSVMAPCSSFGYNPTNASIYTRRYAVVISIGH